MGKVERNNIKPVIYGILLSLAIGIPAHFLGREIPLVGGSVFAITIGMLVNALVHPVRFSKGIAMVSKKGLQYSIVLIGMGLNLRQVWDVGRQSVLIMLCTIASGLIAAWLFGKALGISRNTIILIGVGTSICGGSAIAATAPVISAEDDDVAYAISTIFLFNILAVFIFPALGRALGMDDTRFGMWAGTAINDTSSVVAAAFSYSEAAGEFATVVKLTRTLMIIPITLSLAIYSARRTHTSQRGKRLDIVKIFPWFVLGFLAAVIINTALPASAAPAAALLNRIGKFGIVVAMAAIGLNTDLKKLISNGIRPIMLGLVCWGAVAVTSLLLQSAMGI